MIKIKLSQYIPDKEYTFNIWVNSTILGNLTYHVGMGLFNWSEDSRLKQLIKDKYNCIMIEKMMEEEIVRKAVEEEILGE